MGPSTNRRTFLKDCSASASAVVLAGSTAAATASATEEGTTPYLCVTCGTQFTETARPPAACPICEDERQYVPPEGQAWTTLAALHATHKVAIRAEEEGLHSINVEPKFGIGQRAFLIGTPEGNVLWDCVAPIDPATIARVRGLGGIAEIAVSHPHYYTTMVEWARAFDAPIHIHEAERRWVMRPDPKVQFWSGEEKGLRGGLKLVRSGGHFEGYQVLHWPAGAGGRGALMAGDQPQICMDPKQVSFMYSYPNYIPLDPDAIRRVARSLAPLPFDRLYGAFFIRGKGIIPRDAKAVVDRSVARYLRAIDAGPADIQRHDVTNG